MKDVDVTAPQPINALIYGPSDGGKTTFIGTWPKLAMLITEKTSSLGALADLYQRTRVKPVRTVVAESREDVEEFLTWLEQPGTRSQIQTVAMDSITQHGNNLLLQVIDEHAAVFKRKLRTPESPEMQDWTRILIPELRILKRLSDLGYHTVMTAHARIWITPIERRRYRMATRTGAADIADKIPETYYPNLRGGLGDVLPHFFNLVIFMYHDAVMGERRACFRQSQTYFAKTQYSKLPDILVNPDYEMLVRGIAGEISPAKDDSGEIRHQQQEEDIPDF